MLDDMPSSTINPNNTRQPWEIRLWLRTRFWYPRYFNNLLEEYDQDIISTEPFIHGDAGAYTISGAFNYKSTIEGQDFWLKKEHKFLAWYYHQPREIYRGKWITITNKGIVFHI